MNRTRTDSYYRHLHPDSPRERGPANELLLTNGRRRSDEISLQGSAENVVYRGEPGHFGRIGSALSECEGEQDDEHHEDDIVEHLDVIGASDIAVSLSPLTNSYFLDPAIATVSTLTNAANAIVM